MPNRACPLWSYELAPHAIVHAHNTLGQHALTLPAYR